MRLTWIALLVSSGAALVPSFGCELRQSVEPPNAAPTQNGTAKLPPAADAQLPSVAAGAVAPGLESAPADAAIHKSLAKRVVLDYKSKPLAEVAADVQTKIEAPVLVDNKAIEDVGASADTEITFRLAGVSLGKALEEMLGKHDLNWHVRDGILRITSQERYVNTLDIRVYDVCDLILYRNDKGEWVEGDLEALAALISGTIEPQLWDATGGPGTIKEHTSGMNVLVVSATRHVHEEIDRLLSDLAERRRAHDKKMEEVVRTGGIKHRKSVIVSEIVEEKELPALDTDAGRDAAVQSVNRLAVEMFGQLDKTDSGNLFFSPYSIASALAMTKAGARGKSDKVLAKLLHLSGERKAADAGYASLRSAIEDVTQQGGHELRVANHLWCRTGWRVQHEFVETLKSRYAAELSLLDFGKPDDAAKTINDWVRVKTAEKIPSVVGPEMFDDETRLVLASAIYFKGVWRQPFNADATRQQEFQTPDKVVETPMMYEHDDFGYAEDEGLQILEMPYSPGATSMVILLPRKTGGSLEKIQQALSFDQLKKWMDAIRSREVKVHLPKFKFDSRYDLKEVLSRMGAGNLFDRHEADLSAMVEGERLFLQFLVHAAFVDVNEEGTEAAAATVGGTGGGAFGEPPPVPVFRADHPFLFLIRDVRTGCILFIGRVVDPSNGATAR